MNRMLLTAGLWSLALVTLGQQAPPHPSACDDYAAEVTALADDSYLRRELAKERLRAGGEASRPALIAGLSSPELETRLVAHELLVRIAETRLERQIAALLESHGSDERIDLPGWQAFREAAGDTPQVRLLFVRLVRDHTASLAWIDRLDDRAPGRSSDEILTELNTFLPIEVARINDGDPVRWSLLLLAASRPELRSAPVLSSRLRGGLLNPDVAERLLESAHQETLRRLIGHWLKQSAERYINTSMLKISLTYDCASVAIPMAMQTLESQQATPASVAAAMVLLTRLDPLEARRQLPQWTEDTRVCHVWQIVATRRRAVQTQVGDVALALLLYLDGHDPRQVGFEDLEADPQTIYREFSIGFEDEISRQRARQAAAQLVPMTTLGVEP